MTTGLSPSLQYIQTLAEFDMPIPGFFEIFDAPRAFAKYKPEFYRLDRWYSEFDRDRVGYDIYDDAQVEIIQREKRELDDMRKQNLVSFYLASQVQHHLLDPHSNMRWQSAYNRADLAVRNYTRLAQAVRHRTNFARGVLKRSDASGRSPEELYFNTFQREVVGHPVRTAILSGAALAGGMMILESLLS